VVDPRSADPVAPQLKTVDPETLEFTLAEVEADIEAKVGRNPDVGHTISTLPKAARDAGVTPATLKRQGYELKNEIGRGGLGAVHLARQQAFDRAVAIKRLLVENDPAAARKFFAEAVVTASLEHPNIVPVYDLLSDQHGRLQLVMKRVEGRTWKRILHPKPSDKDEPLTLDDHLDILVKVVEAVSFAHDKGILHRDLKPENVMVGTHGEVLVMDWGCAVAFGKHVQHPGVPRIEAIDQVSGTPAYMAPEMVLVDQRATGPHSDVYLLGGMLYEVITGQRPHAGTTVMAVLRNAALDDVVPPHKRAPERKIPTELADICMNALVREPNRRIPTVAKFHDRLLAYRRHAQAVTLAELAEQLLDESDKAGGKEAHRLARVDDALRRAVAAAENACELWPGWVAGHALAARANLTHARHCFATGGMTQAESLALRALPHAREADDDKTQAAAKTLAEEARRGRKSGQQRERALIIMRRSAVVMGVLMLLGALIAIAIVNGKRHESEEARKSAKEALDQLQQAVDARTADQRRFAPGLVAQAKAAITGGELEAALPSLDDAIAFDPDLVEAVALRANVLAALGKYADALPWAQQWLKARPGDPDASELVGLCVLAKTQEKDVVAARCSDLFLREQLPSLAEKGLKTDADRLVAYQARVREIAPDAADALQIGADGILSFPWPRGLVHHPDLVDLTALRGMPFHDLSLTFCGVADLTPLSGMPLNNLDLSHTKVRDLTPVRSCPLTYLDVSDSPFDPATLAGMKLKTLTAWRDQQFKDLSVLHGMPLERLNVGGCPFADLTPLAGLPLTDLWIDGSFSDLRPLAHCPLKRLVMMSSAGFDFTNTAFTDLEGLRLSGEVTHPGQMGHMRPLNVDAYACNAKSDISWITSIDASRLQEVMLESCDGVPLTPLATVKCTTLTINASVRLDLTPLKSGNFSILKINASDVNWTSLLALKGNPHLKTIILGDGTETPVAEFWRHFDPTFPPLPATNKPTLDAGPMLLPDHPGKTLPGLEYAACDAPGGSLAALANAAVIKAGVALVPTVQALTQKDNSGVRFTGYIEVPSDGVYRFALTSEDGSRLIIDDQVVVDNTAAQYALRYDGLIRLMAGKHTMTLLYAKTDGAAALGLAVQPPQGSMLPVPPSWFSHDAP
jgi:tetratricopeptide (TPR) repeat protein